MKLCRPGATLRKTPLASWNISDYRSVEADRRWGSDALKRRMVRLVHDLCRGHSVVRSGDGWAAWQASGLKADSRGHEDQSCGGKVLVTWQRRARHVSPLQLGHETGDSAPSFQVTAALCQKQPFTEHFIYMFVSCLHHTWPQSR